MMTTHTDADGPLPLPAALVPDGCPAWDAEGGRRWIAALAPRWVPGRGSEAAALGLTATALAASGALHLYAALPAWAAALAALHLVWLTVRPEIVPLPGERPAWRRDPRERRPRRVPG
jgi:hypothetical protein